METKVHYLSIYRINHLNLIVDHLELALKQIVKNYNEYEKYEALGHREEYDETLGFVFMSFQSFITGAIADYLDKPTGTKFTNDEKHEILKMDKLLNAENTIIETINALANFFRHKDEGPLHTETAKIIGNLKIDSSDCPMTDGLYKLQADGNIQKLKIYIINWRENILNKLL